MKSRIKKLFVSFLVTLFALTGIATTTSASTSVTTDTNVKERSVEIQTMPRSMYISNLSRNFSKSYAIPPASYYYTTYSNGVKYAGSLTRVEYVDAVDRWIALYSGYVYRQ